MDLALRPRRASEIVDAAVRLYRQHFGTCLTLAVVLEVPPLILRLATAAGATTSAGLALGLLATPAFLAYYALVSAAFAALSDDAVRTGAPDVARAVRRALGRGWASLGVLLLLALMFGGGVVAAALAIGVAAAAMGVSGFGAGSLANPATAGAAVLGVVALLMVPAAYVFTRFLTAVPTCVVEGAGPGEALTRAWRRGGGHFWHAFAVLLLCILVLLVPLGLAVVAAATLEAGASLGARVAGVLVQTAINALIQPFVPLATQLLYYDLRVRAEGYDLEQMVGALDAAPAGA